MLTLSSRHQIIIGLSLIALFIATRDHHFATLLQLPGASWAVFFLAGIYLRPIWVLPGLLALAWLLDFAAYTWGGVSGYCLTPAYAFLLPAYGALWIGGRWFAHWVAKGSRIMWQTVWQTVIMLLTAILISAVICELFSSGGFYYFSGHFDEPTLMEFASRELRYFPAYLQSMLFYVAIATIVHVVLVLTGRISARSKLTINS